MVNDYGLGYKLSAPNTPDGDYAVEMISRGDLYGSSFAYSTDDKKNVTYKKLDGLLYRIVHKIDRISDISIVANPAIMERTSLCEVGGNRQFTNR